MGGRLIVIGGVAAGMSAAAKAKRVDRELDVVVFEKSPHISYAACGMPYFLSGEIADPLSLVVRTPAQMAKQGVEVKTQHTVVGIDAKAGSVSVYDKEGAQEHTEAYDCLVIATGAVAMRPALPGIDLGGVFALRSLESGLDLQRFLSEQRPRRAVIIGGGYVGVEMAEAFRRRGLGVRMMIRSGKVLRSTLDDDMRQYVRDELHAHGVEITEGVPIGFDGADTVSAVATEGGSQACDLVLLGMGARPNVGLAREAGVVLGTTGAIATSHFMETNVPGVYAAGDCAEAWHLVSGEPAYIPLGSTANKQGRVAGTNAAGGRERFAGIVGTMVLRAFDLVVARTGLTSTQARASGYVIRETKITAKDISHYFPGADNIHVKLVVRDGDDRLLGGQIVGRRGVAKRIDVLATALQQHMTVGDLRQLDLSYAPPFAPVWDPLLVAANIADKS